MVPETYRRYTKIGPSKNFLRPLPDETPAIKKKIV